MVVAQGAAVKLEKMLGPPVLVRWLSLRTGSRKGPRTLLLNNNKPTLKVGGKQHKQQLRRRQWDIK